MNSKPTISVVTSVRNGAKYLRYAIQSVLDQSYGNFEYLIFDNGSVDKSHAILLDFARRDPRVKVFRKEEGSYVAWLNEGISLARGEFIARMDADDICMPSRFERQLEFFEHHSDCLVLGSQMLLIDDAGLPIDHVTIPEEHEEIESQLLQGRGIALPHPSWMVRRDALIGIGQYREGFESAEDFDVLLRLADRGRLANLPDVLMKFRLHPSSVTANRAARQRELKLLSIQETRQRRGEMQQTLDLPQSAPPWAGTFHLKIAGMALRAGYHRTARRHALRALLRMPRNRKPWKLLWLGCTRGTMS